MIKRQIVSFDRTVPNSNTRGPSNPITVARLSGQDAPDFAGFAADTKPWIPTTAARDGEHVTALNRVTGRLETKIHTVDPVTGGWSYKSTDDVRNGPRDKVHEALAKLSVGDEDLARELLEDALEAIDGDGETAAYQIELRTALEQMRGGDSSYGAGILRARHEQLCDLRPCPLDGAPPSKVADVLRWAKSHGYLLNPFERLASVLRKVVVTVVGERKYSTRLTRGDHSGLVDALAAGRALVTKLETVHDQGCNADDCPESPGRTQRQAAAEFSGISKMLEEVGRR